MVAHHLLEVDEEAIAKYLGDLNQPRYRSRQIIEWIFQKGVLNPLEMSNLPRALREQLASDWRYDLPEAEVLVSKDGTQKFTLNIGGETTIESVWIPEKKRNTLCISSQAGCAFKCAFCVTGTLGLKSHLLAYQIVSQLWLVQHRFNLPVSNLVFMGMGEPLHNIENVQNAIHIMTDPERMGFGKRKITVSTVGVADKIKAFVENTGVRIAISLTGATNQKRDQWMPINKRFPMEVLKQKLKEIQWPPGRDITFEYVLIQGKTDSIQDATALVYFLRGLPAKVNVIPYNENEVLPHLKAPSVDTVKHFLAKLRENGLKATIRKNRGADIMGACGQLAGRRIV